MYVVGKLNVQILLLCIGQEGLTYMDENSIILCK